MKIEVKPVIIDFIIGGSVRAGYNLFMDEISFEKVLSPDELDAILKEIKKLKKKYGVQNDLSSR